VRAAADSEAVPFTFPWSSWFESDAALGVARGAWCALARIKREIGLGSR
jgi:hypothetical protein